MAPIGISGIVYVCSSKHIDLMKSAVARTKKRKGGRVDLKYSTEGLVWGKIFKEEENAETSMSQVDGLGKVLHSMQYRIATLSCRGGKCEIVSQAAFLTEARADDSCDQFCAPT